MCLLSVEKLHPWSLYVLTSGLFCCMACFAVEFTTESKCFLPPSFIRYMWFLIQHILDVLSDLFSQSNVVTKIINSWNFYNKIILKLRLYTPLPFEYFYFKSCISFSDTCFVYRSLACFWKPWLISSSFIKMTCRIGFLFSWPSC